MAKRRKSPVTVVPTRDEAMDEMAKYAKLFIEQKGLEAKMNAELQAVNDKYKTDIDHLQLDMDGHFAKIKLYAEEHKPDFEEKRRSQNWTHGMVGFRTGTPKVAIEKGFEIDGECVNLKNIVGIMTANSLDGYLVRKAPSLNKQKIIETFKGEDQEKIEDLKVCGLRVVQDETFFIDVEYKEIEA